MTLAQGTEQERHDRRRWLIILPLLLSLFLSSLGVFTFLMRQGAAPRLELPEAFGGARGKPRFERMLEPLSRPLAVAVSPDGKRLYVAEGGGEYALQVLDTDGQRLVAASAPHTTPTTRQPMSVAVAPDGTVYVADRRLRQILIFEADGAYRDVLRPAGIESWAPLGVAVSRDGTIYVSESLDLPEIQRHRIYVMQPDGTIVKQFGEKGEFAGNLLFPGPLAVDNRGRIWVGDMTGVKVFDPDGTYLFRLKTEGDGAVALPGGLAFRDGRMFIADTINHRVMVYDATGDVASFSAEFGQLGFGRGQMRYPAGMAVSASRIYIADRENGRVDIWTP